MNWKPNEIYIFPLTIFLHFKNIFANSFNFLLTWKWPKIGQNVVFIRDFYRVKFKKENYKKKNRYHQL